LRGFIRRRRFVPLESISSVRAPTERIPAVTRKFGPNLRNRPQSFSLVRGIPLFLQTIIAPDNSGNRLIPVAGEIAIAFDETA
jgi:hypothetical protein